jgi:CRP-like cAMP-binding protein
MIASDRDGVHCQKAIFLSSQSSQKIWARKQDINLLSLQDFSLCSHGQLRIDSTSVVDANLNSRLLDGMDEPDRAAILQAGKERQFAAKSVIVNQAQRANKFFLLLDGHARHFFITENGEKLLLRWLVPGDVTGGVALLSRPSRYHVGTEVITESRLLIWDWATIQRLTIRFPALLRNSLFLVEDYMHWYLTAQIALTCRTGRQRTAYVLKNIARTVGRKVTGGIELAITNEELASAAAVTLFAASRFMGEWQRSGAIVKTRGKILVRSFDLLCQD